MHGIRLKQMNGSRTVLGVVLAVILLAGDAAVVQTLAWVSMLATRTASMGFSQAAESTFGGADPCHLCLAAASLREQPQPEAPIPELKLVKTFAVLSQVWAETPPPTLLACVPPIAPLAQPRGHRQAPDPPPPRRG